MGADVLGNDFCCPSGMFCNETDSGLFRCDMRLENCVDQDSEEDCEDNGCVWMDIDEECAENPRDYDCGYYDTETSCLNDEWDLGTSGIGTEFCGSTIQCNGEAFSVPESSCGCEWYPSAPSGDKCQLKMTAVQMNHGATPDKFECSNVYSLGDCTDGVQNVSWFSSSNVVSGFSEGVIPYECLDALGCNNGESTRFCGEPIIKLSVFSYFSLFLSLFFICVYYFFVRKI